MGVKAWPKHTSPFPTSLLTHTHAPPHCALPSNLYDHDTSKQQFHCAGCGLCRVGGGEHFRHCPKCQTCVGKLGFESHKCLEGASQAACPVCQEDMFSSTQGSRALRCGHYMVSGAAQAPVARRSSTHTPLHCPLLTLHAHTPLTLAPSTWSA